MNFLLDTHVFLWYVLGDPRIPPHWLALLRDPANNVFLSVLSLWETCIKHQLGKLPLPVPPETYIPAQRDLHGIASLSLEEAAIRHLAALPPLHRDPFDRMLICQAIEHGLVLVTFDEVVKGYPVATLE